MSSTLIARRCWRSRKSARICALDGDVERRRRLVGERSIGLQARAIADHHALALSPDSWCGGVDVVSGSGMPTVRKSSTARARACLRVVFFVEDDRFDDLPADV